MTRSEFLWTFVGVPLIGGAPMFGLMAAGLDVSAGLLGGIVGATVLFWKVPRARPWDS